MQLPAKDLIDNLIISLCLVSIKLRLCLQLITFIIFLL